jgi:RNA ligase (TIGR02306 family)
MNPVSIVKIKEILPLYKKEEQANAVELIKIEEADFELVCQKGLYQVGNSAVYIQPDYCISDIPLFESFIRPNGDESKSMLGSVGGQKRRIRAKKFTLSKEPNGEPVYSNGILLPYNEVNSFIRVYKLKNNTSLENLDLTELLGITKYEEPEEVNNGQKASNFPEGIYKTDEDNFLKCGNKFNYPCVLVGTEKVDGSSITIGITKKYPDGFICSRNVNKKIFIKKATGKKRKTFWEKLQFWKKFDLNIYEEVLNTDDAFVKYGYPYLKRIEENFPCDEIILRGELNGGSAKGSGNKNNPASKEPINIKFFGIDIVENGIAKKLGYIDFVNGAYEMMLPLVKPVFHKEFNSKEEVIIKCNSYFKNNMIEGVVVRTLDSTMSAKVMNLEYDSKK